MFSRSLIYSSASYCLLVIPSNVFFSCYCILQFSDICLVLLFSISLFKFSLCSSVLPSSVSIFVTVTLKCLSGKLLSQFIKGFSGVFTLSFVWNIFLSFLICFPLCFYVLGETTLPVLEWPCVGNEAYCSTLS